jgi:hypothetical protein
VLMRKVMKWPSTMEMKWEKWVKLIEDFNIKMWWKDWFRPNNELPDK